MKKALAVMLFALGCAGVWGISQATGLFLGFEPSSINNGMGYEPVGAANIWHPSALTAYRNPAIPALKEGITYSTTRINWLAGSGFDDMYYNAALLSASYMGIGLLLPAPNANLGKFGINFDLGEQVQMDEHGNYIGTFNSYDDALVWGISLNPLETYRRLDPNHFSLLKYIDLAIGVNYVGVHSYLGPGTGQTEESGDIYTSSLNLGAIAKLNYCLADLVTFEAVYGFGKFNLAKTEITYPNQEQTDPVWRHDNHAVALSLSIPSKRILKGIIDQKYLFFDNLLSVRALGGTITAFDSDPIPGKGLEAGLLDTFFFRVGDYQDVEGSITGPTIGYGLNIHFKDMASIMLNYSVYPGGELVDHNTSYDLNFSINPLKLYEVIKNK